LIQSFTCSNTDQSEGRSCMLLGATVGHSAIV
jgi:hypothetical protein